MPYIDASYGTQEDRKSHSGVIIVNTKSSCEAELVGVSDGINPGL